MKRYLNVFLKLFIGETIAFGVLVSLLSVLQGIPVSAAWISGLFIGLLLGLGLSLIVSFLHLRSVKSILPEGYQEALGVHHTRSIDLRIPYDKAFDLCIDSLKLIRRGQVQNQERAQGKIFGRAGAIWSRRDVIVFNVDKASGERVRVNVSSRPALRTTLIDFGRNLENVETIVSHLVASTAHKRNAR